MEQYAAHQRGNRRDGRVAECRCCQTDENQVQDGCPGERHLQHAEGKPGQSPDEIVPFAPVQDRTSLPGSVARPVFVPWFVVVSNSRHVLPPVLPGMPVAKQRQ